MLHPRIVSGTVRVMSYHQIPRDGLGRSVPRQPALSPAFHDIDMTTKDEGVHLYRQPPSGQVLSLLGHASTHRWRLPPRVRRHKASSPQESSSNGCCIFRLSPWDQLMPAPLFPTPTILILVCIIDTGTADTCDTVSLPQRRW